MGSMLPEPLRSSVLGAHRRPQRRTRRRRSGRTARRPLTKAGTWSLRTWADRDLTGWLRVPPVGGGRHLDRRDRRRDPRVGTGPCRTHVAHVDVGEDLAQAGAVDRLLLEQFGDEAVEHLAVVDE